MALTEHQRFCQMHIKAAEEAGQPLAVYARDHEISVHRLYSEKQRVARLARKQTATFIRVEDPAHQVLPPTVMQIRLPNGVTLALPSHQLPLDQILQSLVKL